MSIRWENDPALGNKLSAIKQKAGSIDRLARDHEFKALYKLIGEINDESTAAIYRMNDIMFQK